MVDSFYKNRLFDVVVIGGGISGLGIALECSSRGFDTVLLERDKICLATSDQSLRVIHGGFRYLQNGNLLRIIESLRDQTRVLKEAPSLVKLLPCVMPLQRFGMKSRGPVEVAANFYNFLCEQVVGQRSRAGIISSEFVSKHVQLLRGFAPHGALLWYDARLRDPQKFSALIRHKIDREGGEVVEGMNVMSVARQQNVFVVRCTDGEEEGEICGRVVVNATGPWLKDVTFDGVQRKGPKTWCRAFNIILNRKLQERFAVAAKSPAGRMLFTVPRAEVTAIGTGYLPYEKGDAKEIQQGELQQFLDDCNATFHGANLSTADIREVEVGIIPARVVSPDGLRVKLYGRSQLWDYNGFIDVLSTKYTTFHSLGNQVLRKALKYLR